MRGKWRLRQYKYILSDVEQQVREVASDPFSGHSWDLRRHIVWKSGMFVQHNNI